MKGTMARVFFDGDRKRENRKQNEKAVRSNAFLYYWQLLWDVLNKASLFISRAACFSILVSFTSCFCYFFPSSFHTFLSFSALYRVIFLFFIPSAFPHPSFLTFHQSRFPNSLSSAFSYFPFIIALPFSYSASFFVLFRSLNPLFYPFSFVQTFYFSVPRLLFGSRSLSVSLIPSSL